MKGIKAPRILILAIAGMCAAFAAVFFHGDEPWALKGAAEVCLGLGGGYITIAVMSMRSNAANVGTGVGILGLVLLATGWVVIPRFLPDEGNPLTSNIVANSMGAMPGVFLVLLTASLERYMRERGQEE